MKKNISETTENKTYSICKNSVINLYLPEINSSQTILIYGNTINFFGVPDKKCFVGNNTNEYDRLGWLITAIRNKYQFYIICIDNTAIKYYKALFNRIYNDFNYKADIKALDICNLVYNKDKVDGKASIDILEKNIQKYNIMKFDICLMNPPYGQSIHYDFTAKTLLYADKVISIMPNSIIKRDSKHFKKFKEVYNNRLYKVEEIPSNIFDDTSMQNVAIYSFNEYTDKLNINYLNGQHEEIIGGIMNKDYLGFSGYEKEIVNFLLNNNKHWMPYVDLRKIDKPTVVKANNKLIKKYVDYTVAKLPDNKVYMIVNATDGTPRGGWTHKFFSSKVGQIFNNKEELKKCLIEKNGASIHYMWFDSELAAKNCKDAMQRPLLRFPLLKLQTDQHLNKIHYSYIPDINWEDPCATTDEALLEVCGCPKDKAKEYAEYCRKKIEEFDNKERTNYN